MMRIGRIMVYVCLTGMLLASCVERESPVSVEVTDNVEVGVEGMTRAAIENTRVYLFNDNTQNTFAQRVTDVHNVAENTLKMTIPAKTWNIWLLSSEDGSGMDGIAEPTAGDPRSSGAMYRLKPVGGTLSSAPVLITGEIENQTILADQNQNASVVLSRNMAMVMFVIDTEDAKVLDPASPQVVSLGNIPAAIGWDGGLFPSAANPEICAGRMSDTFPIVASNGEFRCDTVRFIVPAHKGPEDLGTLLDVSVELTTTTGGHYTPDKPVEIDANPKANERLLVHLKPNIDGELEVESAEVLPWGVGEYWESLSGGDGSLEVDRATVYLTSEEAENRVYYKIREVDELQVTMSESWARYDMEIDPISGEPYVQFYPDMDRYTGEPLEWFADFTVGHFTKRIRVGMRPNATGSIVGTPNPVVLYPDYTYQESPGIVGFISGRETADVSFSLTPADSKFSIMTGSGMFPLTNSNVVHFSPTLPSGYLHFTRKAHSSEAELFDTDIYDNDTLRVLNTSTFEVEKVIVKNLFMQAQPVYVPSEGEATTVHTVVSSDIEAYGGERRFEFDRYNTTADANWIKSVACIPNPDPATYGSMPYVLKIQVTGNDGMPRTGYFWIRSVDDPDYKIRIEVRQQFSTDIPPFDFFVINFAWENQAGVNDLDVAVEFRDNNALFDTVYQTPFLPMVTYNAIFYTWPGLVGMTNPNCRAIGFWLSAYVTLEGGVRGTNTTSINQAHLDDKVTLALFGGDAMSGGEGETVFFKAPMISPETPAEDTLTDIERYITMDIYAIWYGGHPGEVMTATVDTYEGGRMVKVPSEAGGFFKSRIYNVPEGMTGENLLSDPSLENEPIFHEQFTRPVYALFSSGIILPDYSRGTAVRNFNSSVDFRKNYTHIATIHYDRYRRTIRIEWDNTSPLRMPLGSAVGYPSDDMTDEEKRAYKEAQMNGTNY